ncbi:MAG: hypothetical protein AVDCRST_MAG89-2557 [uncultured Gemmatimonadetes bacterium]|uniref:Lipid/polyisoprenoid-binding YceI-like domain-containing protein n=1 Tax=uncultured Gemmatimonadota bacterium TaxID=203437 RepID=A0A6J4LSG0_9BACT|nr:MAG: hypothetical protein AVDCRST_MAG89-2557 [uncultured Gemmatimonadota bacterium]
MRNRTIHKLFGSAAIVLALAACGDSTGNEDSNRGSIAFSYSGAESGSFDADGEFRRGVTTSTTFSAAVIDEDGITLIGNEARTNNRSDLFLMVVPERRGTTTCTADDFDCEMLALFLLNASDTDQLSDGFFGGTDGSVNVTGLTENRVRGTFSLNLEDIESTAGTPAIVRLRSGTFDVPIVTQGELGGSLNRAPAAQAELLRVLRARAR